MTILFPFLLTWFLASLLQFALWRKAMREENGGWVDLGWTLGMAIGGLTLPFVLGPGTRVLAVTAVLMFWSLRLAWHIYRDRLHKNPVEDGRYTALRAHWGKNAKRNFFFFFEGQALLSAIFLLPGLIVAQRPEPFPNLFDLFGISLAFLAVFGERTADQQLAVFRRQPENKGKVCDTGLWHYSRHPNYFFEFLHWTAYIVWGWGAEAAPVTWLGASLMYIFLRYLTGVPHTERQSLKSRGEAYARYQQTTPVFFPWIPRKP